MKSLILVILLLFILGFFGFSTAYAELELEYTPPCFSGLPGECPSDAEVSTDISSYIIRIYQFGVGIAGVLAVGMIVAGAIYYSISAGNPDKQRDARGMITGALWGVALLLGSYLILNTINPQIIALERIGGDSLPIPSTILSRACSDVSDPEPGENCLPACGEGERACGPGENAGAGTPACTKCADPILRCPEEFFDSNDPQYCSPITRSTIIWCSQIFQGGCGQQEEREALIAQIPARRNSTEETACLPHAFKLKKEDGLFENEWRTENQDVQGPSFKVIEEKLKEAGWSPC